MKITVYNKTKNATKTDTIELSDVVEEIRELKYADAIKALRVKYPFIKISPGDIHSPLPNEHVLSQIPSVCFSSVIQIHNKKEKIIKYNKLVLLEIDNLPDYETAASLRNKSGHIPYTLIAFVGATGRELKIVCKAESHDGLPIDTEAEAQQLQIAAYARLHYLYTNDLMVTVENKEPLLSHTCKLSADADIFYNPNAEPIRVEIGQQIIKHQNTPSVEQDERGLLPGMDKEQTASHLFEACLAKAYDELARNPAEDEISALASLLATYCSESGIPKAVAKNKCKYKKWYYNNELTVNDIFDNAYRDKEIRINPTRHISRAQLLVMKTENFMRTHYELRKNVLTGIAQYRDRGSYYYEWQDITDSVSNTMTIEAQRNGIDSWDKDIHRFLNSTLISQYDPLEDWLRHLPTWDGKERIKDMAARIPTQNETWEYSLHIWLLSMVAHWMGKDTMHGNAIVPLLVGYQGCGKTTFCSQILPQELRTYYSDDLNFKNDTSLLLALSSYALINIDEFDKITKRQQPVLKYLLSKSDVKLRMPYGQTMEGRRRYASFIATTNNQQPLIDDTGSRRFVCIKVEKNIDTGTPINYPQLYAQLLHELNEGYRYWFNEEETSRIMKDNTLFQRTEGLDEILLSLFRRPRENEEMTPLNISDIITTIKCNMPNFQANDTMAARIGCALNRLDIQKNRKKNGTYYNLLVRSTTKKPAI